MQVPGNEDVGDTPQLEPSPKKQRLSPRAAAKETAEQSGSVARAQAIADRLAALAGGQANGIPAPPLATVSSAPEQTRPNGLAAEPASLPAANGIPGVSTAEQQAQQPSGAPEPAAAEIPRRRRPSMFNQPAVEAQLPPPPQLPEKLPRPPMQLPEQLPGPPPQPPPQPQLQSDISRESQESMRDKAQAIAARFAASAAQSSLPALAPTGDSSHRPAAKQPGTAGASAESEFEDDSDPFHGLSSVPPALPLPQTVRSMPAQPHLASLSLPPPVAKQLEHHASQPKLPPAPRGPDSHASQPVLPPPPQGQVSGAWERDGSAAQQRAPQPPRGPPPGHPQVPPPRPPPPGPRPPPGAPPAPRPPQHYPQYPPHLHVSHPCHLPFCLVALVITLD